MIDLLIRFLLFLYPRDTRRRFGPEMRLMMCENFTQSSRGVILSSAFLLRDTLCALPAAHLTIWMERIGLSPKPPPLRYSKPQEQPMREERESVVYGMVRDIRYAMRSLLKNPGFTATAIAAFAVGIGANAAIFSMVYSILIRPLPFSEPQQLVLVEGTSPERGIEKVPFSYPDFKDMQRLNESYADLAAVWDTPFLFTAAGTSTMWDGAFVSANLTEMLGVRPVVGRTFRESEEANGQRQAILIGEGLWRRQFGGDESVVGTTIVLDGTPSTIAGVLPGHFRFPGTTEVWILLTEDRMGPREHRHLSLVGRLKPEATEQHAEAELNQIALGLSELYPDTNGDLGVRVRSLREGVFGNEKRPVLVFYAVACLLMLLACANVASLILARNESRRGELAVRISLGAGRRRLLQYVLAESAIVAVVGGMLGVALGWYGRDLLLALRAVELPYYLLPEVRLDVLFPIAGVVMLTGLLTGLLPALTVTRTAPNRIGRSAASRHSEGLGASRFNAALVSLEVALALVVLIGTNLMVKSALEQRSINPGYSPQDVATLRLQLPEGRLLHRAERWEFYRQVLDEVRSHPAVASASVVSRLPSNYQTDPWPIVVEGNELSGSGLLPQYLYRVCEQYYFSTLGIPLIAGRTFESSDADKDAPAVAIVGAEFARQFWPGQDPIGKRLAFGDVPTADDGVWINVVGVVGDTYNIGYGRPLEPTVYIPWSDFAPMRTYLVARMESGAGGPFPLLGERVRAVDPEILIWDMRTMEQAMFETHWQVRFYSWGLAMFSVIALILASTGVYGIVSHAVTRRLREYAIRMAVGADGRAILGAVVRANMTMTAGGVAAGLVLALVVTRFMARLLFKVHPVDLSVYGFSTGLLIGAALAAGYLPVRRLFRIEPTTVLSEE